MDGWMDGRTDFLILRSLIPEVCDDERKYCITKYLHNCVRSQQSQLIKKILTFYGTRSFNTMFVFLY
jgi:hypothetical protein